jgi:hypothetical protein
VLRRVFGPKREEVTGEWRRLLRSFVILTKCYSGDQIKKAEMGGHLACMGGRRDTVGLWWVNRGKRTTWKA